MADSKFRAYRGRDDVARDEIDANAPDAVRDPLAELARLIGQGDPVNDFSRNARRQPAPQYDSPAPAVAAADRPTDQAYADQDQYDDEGYAEPQAVEPYPPAPELPRYGRDDARMAPLDSQYSEPEDDYAAPAGREPQYEDSYQNDEPPVLPRGRRLPALAPQSDDEYENEKWQDESEDQSYASEDYEEDAESVPRRSGMVLIMAVLGLVIIGVASAFAYRSMVGGVLLPTLPPIIKANDAPNKIIPAQAATASGADASGAKSGEKLVSREEQPVPIQPQNPPPRVVATIPVATGQGAAPSGPQSANSAAPVPAPQSVFPPPPAPAPAAQAPAAGSAEPKKIHTVLIHADQSGGASSAAAAPAVPPARPSATARVAPRPNSTSVAKPAANAPLALVPIAEGRAAPVEPSRTQVARRETSAAPLSASSTATDAAPAAGGYAVQVTSQRSEVEAEAAYKSLQAKFPAQLGGHHAIIHRAELGAKGTFYRALVGPFTSAEAATGLCSNLKAAGGSCIVQRN